MSVTDPRNSMQVCVRHCPTSDITTEQHAREFAVENSSRLCRYDIEPERYEDETWSEDGPCPQLPVYKRHVSVFLLSLVASYDCYHYHCYYCYY